MSVSNDQANNFLFNPCAYRKAPPNKLKPDQGFVNQGFAINARLLPENVFKQAALQIDLESIGFWLSLLNGGQATSKLYF
ncbi:hypothetical protein A1353_14005 [Methylomonas methanica]|uniref:Uncharacterized protein n=1 Tax=Methylomonas methanica TaxID=421 RepID=A0A177MFX3_METMH|nr:hypothetical protein [Methylomonas methanica]OAI03850.1 hypothetical protein A1353_14005 [Methylomonas methanica]